MKSHTPETSPDLAEMKIKLNTETAKISWLELQRFFAAGKVLRINQSIDLVTVAAHLAVDDKPQVERWMNTEMVQAISNEQAQHWVDAQEVLWSVVVSPWVLVQEISATSV